MDNSIPVPTVRLNDAKPFNRVPTDLTTPRTGNSPDLDLWQTASLPNLGVVATRGDVSIARFYTDMLRKHAIPPLENPNANFNKRFLPQKLLEHILNRRAVLEIINELLINGKLSAEVESKPSPIGEAGKYWTDKICGAKDQPGARRILALLLLQRKEGDIKTFIDQGLTDSDIPLEDDSIEFPVHPSWEEHEKDNFRMYQRNLAVPFFGPSPTGPFHYELDKEDIKPWAQASPSIAQLQNLTLGGGYAEVRQKIIHPWQHGFHEILEELSAPKNLFAFKCLLSSNEQAFKKETQMLTRFGGNHRNIVTLLATLAWENGLAKQYCLLFPWAECDLLRYWERMKIPNKDYSTHKWIVNQYRGIIDAIAFIHKPNMKNSKGQQLYGRHGDIKPENILWFRKDTGGLLVLSDLGLAAEHRDASRSNIPGHDIPNTPNYRPPECDMDGEAGFISRSFDIWTLGCLFLEFVIWTLCGWDERERFRSERFSPYINGIQKDIYFDVCRLPEKKDAYAFKIKDAVTRRFASLHEHPDCSPFLHDLLDLIQSRLLIVESDEPHVKRIKAAELLEEIQRLANKCNDKSYCLGRCPRETTHEPLDPVEVPLNRNAKRIIDAENMDSKLPQHPGRTRTANRRLGPLEIGLRLGV